MTDTKTKEFINKAIKIHGDRYDYSKVVYIKAKEKVNIICIIHGDFLQTPNGHLNGKGCIKCSGNYIPTTEEWIIKANKIHCNKYDYSKVNYNSSSKKVIIVCKVHGDFLQTPNGHLKSSGCIKCSSIYAPNTEEWIIKAKNVHGDIYDYSKVNYINNISKVIIICKEHGEFKQTPKQHLNSSGCIKCSGSYIPTTEEWIIKAKNVHGDRYDYSNAIYKKASEKIIIICKIHGEFPQTPNGHLNGKGCIKCSGNYTPTTEEWIVKARKVHNDKYDYSKVIYKDKECKIIIICLIHGEFEQAPHSHLNGNGCPICGINKMKQSQKKSIDLFIEQSKIIHGHKYDYTNVIYDNTNTKVNIYCIEHKKMFSQLPKTHLKGQTGCKLCFNKHYSKKQINWIEFIMKKENIYIQHALNNGEYKIPKTLWKADGYCKETNTIYEFHGTIYHGDPRCCNPNSNNYLGKNYKYLYDTTILRESKIKNLGYNLVVMWEYDWDRINKSVKILQQKFSKSIH